MKTRHAFTLTELLVALATLVVLAGTVLPGLVCAKNRSRTARCASNMRLWGAALSMYASDNRDEVPFFGVSSTANTTYEASWMTDLQSYLGFSFPLKYGGSTGSEIYTNKIRMCPESTAAGQPIEGVPHAWIGANFGQHPDLSGTMNGIFVYSDADTRLMPRSAIKILRIRKPSDCMAFMDVHSYWVYNPLSPAYKWTTQTDAESPWNDTFIWRWNYGNPKVHQGGANVTLVDGHVERVRYLDLYASRGLASTPSHSFWYPED